jgi:hypothetical protein
LGLVFAKKPNQKIKSPIKQVNTVKRNLRRLHIQGLDEEIRKNAQVEYCIKTCVIFTLHSTDYVLNFLNSKRNNEDTSYQNHIKYAYPKGKDSLTSEGMSKLMQETWIGKNSHYFNDRVYDLFHRHFQTPIHLEEEGIDIVYSSAQKELIKSQPVWRKIKGAAGSGKTIVLAARAVNALLGQRNVC